MLLQNNSGHVAPEQQWSCCSRTTVVMLLQNNSGCVAPKQQWSCCSRTTVVMLLLQFRNSDGNTAENSSSLLLSQSLNSKETTLGLLQLEDEGTAILRFGNYVFTN
jgi:hypothetical protein